MPEWCRSNWPEQNAVSDMSFPVQFKHPLDAFSKVEFILRIQSSLNHINDADEHYSLMRGRLSHSLGSIQGSELFHITAQHGLPFRVRFFKKPDGLPSSFGIFNFTTGAASDVAADINDEDFICHVNLALVHIVQHLLGTFSPNLVIA